MKNNKFIHLTSMTAQVAAKELEKLTHFLFFPKEKRLLKDKEIQTQIAEIIFSKMSHLKGIGLKILQSLSLDEELLPKEYIKKFENSYNQVTPLTRPVVKKIIKTELKTSPDDIFSSFDYQAFAAASLGQVHRAITKDNQHVVTKIQYPSIQINMQSELKFIQLVASTISNPLIKNSIEEISENLLNETDYNLEAKNLALFRDIAIREHINIPTPLLEYSTSKVLTMSSLDGHTIDLETNQKIINNALEKIFHFFFISLNEISAIHTDPHPGNIIVNSYNVSLLDFGSIKKDIPEPVKKLFLLLMNKNADSVEMVKLYKQLGCTVTTNPMLFYNKYISQFHDLCTTVIGQKNISFSDHSTLASKMRYLLLNQSQEEDLQDLSKDFTLLHKSFQSLLLLLCKYKASINTEVKLE